MQKIGLFVKTTVHIARSHVLRFLNLTAPPLPHLLSAATACSLGEVCGDHYPLPNSEFPEIGEEIGKT
ncbi:MAG: hypothetical protein ABGW75_11140, partial [Pirellulales bacterium]